VHGIDNICILSPQGAKTCFFSVINATWPLVHLCCTDFDNFLVLCLSVCNVGVLWPNGWTDQDETWHAGRPRPWPHCVRWGPSSPSPKGAQKLPQLSAHICCSQMAAWIKVSLGREVGLGPGDFVLDGDSAPPSPKGGQSPPNFRPMFIRTKRLDG